MANPRNVRCDRCDAMAPVLHYDGEALLCAGCCKALACERAAECSPADLVPIRLAGRRAARRQLYLDLDLNTRAAS